MRLSPETIAKAKRKANRRRFQLWCLSLIALFAIALFAATGGAGANRPVNRLQALDGRS
jgi:hypothetical protein